MTTAPVHARRFRTKFATAIPLDDNHSKTMASNSDPISNIENMDRTQQIGDLSIYYYYARTVGPVLSAVFLVG